MIDLTDMRERLEKAKQMSDDLRVMMGLDLLRFERLLDLLDEGIDHIDAVTTGLERKTDYRGSALRHRYTVTYRAHESNPIERARDWAASLRGARCNDAA